MKVILIQPSERMLVGKKKKYGSIMPPLGLLSLAACVREKCKNVDISIMDYEVKNGDKEPDYSQFDIIGLTGTTVHIPHARVLIETIRSVNEQACIIMGGPHATFAYSSLLNDIPQLDAVIRGEGELSLVEFINKYTSREKLPCVKGVINRNSTEFDLSDIPMQLDELPMYAYDLINLGKYQLSTHRKSLPMPFASIMTSRGCPFSCNYCQTPIMFGNRIRYRSEKLIYEEIKKLHNLYKIESVVFWDDTFTSNRSYTMNLCNLLEDLKIKWMCNTRVDCVDEVLLKKMKSAGCEVIFFGVETFDLQTLSDLNRTTNEEKVRKAFRLCKQLGIKTVAALMIGTPNDELDTIESNIDKLISLEPTDVYISIYNITIGSREYERVVKSGILEETIDWYNPKLFFGPPFGLPTVSTLSRYQLQQAQKLAYRKFYGKDKENQFE